MDTILYGKFKKVKQHIETESLGLLFKFDKLKPINLNITDGQTNVGDGSNPIVLVAEKLFNNQHPRPAYLPNRPLTSLIKIEFQVSTNIDFSNNIVSDESTNFNYTCNKASFSHNTKYYWRYRHVIGKVYNRENQTSDGWNTNSPWSKVTSFTTGSW